MVGRERNWALGKSSKERDLCKPTKFPEFDELLHFYINGLRPHPFLYALQFRLRFTTVKFHFCFFYIAVSVALTQHVKKMGSHQLEFKRNPLSSSNFPRLYNAFLRLPSSLTWEFTRKEIKLWQGVSLIRLELAKRIIKLLNSLAVFHFSRRFQEERGSGITTASLVIRLF